MFSALKKFLGGAEKKEILAPVSGKVIPMSQVADPTFSQEILGKGVAVIPSEGRIVAPASGEVVVMFETKHAVSIKADNGAELIVHIGLDTVNLKGCYPAFYLVLNHTTFSQIKKGHSINYSDGFYIGLLYAVPLVIS